MGCFVLFRNMRLESVAGGTELVAVRTGEAVSAQMLGLDVIVDGGGVAGGVVAVCAAV